MKPHPLSAHMARLELASSQRARREALAFGVGALIALASFLWFAVQVAKGGVL